MRKLTTALVFTLLISMHAIFGDVIYIAYYTVQTPYEEEIKHLQSSLEEFGLPHDIQGVPNRGSWQKNTQYKALFVQNMLSKYPDKAVVYVDADAVIRSYPALFDELNCDIAVHHYDNKKRGFKELLSGTVYFGATPKARELVESWVQVNKEFPDQWDQKNLAIAIERAKNLNVAELPASYCLIFDLMKDQGPAVIEHFQASRRFKGQIHEDTVTTE